MAAQAYLHLFWLYECAMAPFSPDIVYNGNWPLPSLLQDIALTLTSSLRGGKVQTFCQDNLCRITCNGNLSNDVFVIQDISCLFLLTRICPAFANSVDPDQFASSGFWSKSVLFVIKYSRLSLSRNPRDSVKHFEISILQHIRFAELRKQLIKQPPLAEWIFNLTPKLEIYWKYCGKEEKLLLRSNFSSLPQYFVACW